MGSDRRAQNKWLKAELLDIPLRYQSVVKSSDGLEKLSSHVPWDGKKLVVQITSVRLTSRPKPPTPRVTDNSNSQQCRDPSARFGNGTERDNLAG
jgi:hypothetical protein